MRLTMSTQAGTIHYSTLNFPPWTNGLAHTQYVDFEGSESKPSQDLTSAYRCPSLRYTLQWHCNIGNVSEAQAKLWSQPVIIGGEVW